MEVRKVSSKSQLTLPKEFAGQLVSVEKLAEGVLQIKKGRFIPDSENDFQSGEYKNRLRDFDRWMDQHTLKASDVDALPEDS